MQQSKDISIITPVYKAEKIVAELVAEIIRSIEQETLNYEIILVEDASPDASWKAIQNACASNSNIKGVRLEKNFLHPVSRLCKVSKKALLKNHLVLRVFFLLNLGIDNA